MFIISKLLNDISFINTLLLISRLLLNFSDIVEIHNRLTFVFLCSFIKMANLHYRVSQQETRFSIIQRFYEEANDDQPSGNRQLINTRLEILESNWLKFQIEHESICNGEFGPYEDNPYIKNKTYERCLEFYMQARASWLTLQESVEATNASTRVSTEMAPNSQSYSRRFALPKLTLPKFSGDFHTWRTFHDLFTSIVIKNIELTNAERMQYLKTSLSGEAERLISSLPVSDENFAIAWNSLTSRYENKRFLLTAQFDKLFNIKPIKANTSHNLSALRTTVTESLSALRALGCPVEHWDSFLVYHLARLLDDDTRKAWELKLGSSTVFPTFSLFEEFLMSRSLAQESLALQSTSLSSGRNYSDRNQKSQDFRSRVLTITTDETAGGTKCILCNANHKIHNCQRYQAYSPDRRSNTVHKFKLCFNCLGNHQIKNCSSVRRCLKCGKKHHTSLHRNNNTQPVKKSQMNSNQTSSTTGLSVPSSSQ